MYISNFLKTAEYYSIVYSSLLIHHPVGEYLVGFQFLDIVNKAAMNISVQIFLWAYLVVSTYTARFQKL